MTDIDTVKQCGCMKWMNRTVFGGIMKRSTLLRGVTAALFLFATTGCHHPSGGRLLMGDPQAPYPPSAPPKVGDIIHMPTGLPVTLAQMLQIAVDSRVVYVGETHDNPASHRLELQALQALEERYPGKVALGMEMFTRSQQPVLDRWTAGKLDEKNFLKESAWFDNWKMDFNYYRDLLIFARDKHIPVIALNAEKTLVKAVRSKPLEELTPAEKSQLPEMDLTDPYQRGMAQGIFGGHTHGEMHMDGFIRVQTLWDETMAESAARFLKSPQGQDRHLLVIAGANHIKNGFGIPRRMFRRLPTSYVTIGGDEIAVAKGKVPETMDVEIPAFPMVPYEFLVFFTYETLPQQPVLLGVIFEPTPGKHGLLVSGVVPGSNAERAGVQQGDLLLKLDGEALSDSYDLIYAIKQKKVGDKSTLEVERKGQPVKLNVVYQAGGMEHGMTKPDK
jgi:uncharacterized iron-regulated protein